MNFFELIKKHAENPGVEYLKDLDSDDINELLIEYIREFKDTSVIDDMASSLDYFINEQIEEARLPDRAGLSAEQEDAIIERHRDDASLWVAK